MTFVYRGIFGFDISSWQDSPLIAGTVDFQKMKSYGGRFVVFRASIGNVEDADYKTFMANSRNVLPRSAYHYYSPSVDAKLQAARFWNTIKDEQPRMVWLDCEEGGTDTWRGWYDWIEEFKRLSGYTDDRIGIYTGYYIWTQITTYATNAQKAYFGKFKLWLAWYFDDPFHPDYSTVRIPYPWSEIDILQSGTPAIGSVVGVESKEIDYNHFNGDENKLALFFGVQLPQPQDPPQNIPSLTHKLYVYSDGSVKEII